MEGVFRLLVRLYPPRTRERFGDGLVFGWRNDLARARRRGAGAVAVFWVNTVIDTCRFALEERSGGLSMRGFLTVDWRDAWRSLRVRADGDGVLRVLARPRHRRRDGALLHSQQPGAEAAAGARPQRLALLADNSWTNPIWEAIRGRRQAFAADAFAWGNDRFNLSATAAADMVEGFWVSGRHVRHARRAGRLGRTLTEADDVRGGGPAARWR